MDLVESAVREKGFSAAVSARVVQSKRMSTQEIYESRWRKFVEWCGEQSVNPLECSYQKVADFFIHLFEVKGKAAGTIEGYKAAIVDTFKIFERDDISTNSTITCLIRSFHLDKSRPKKDIFKWSLSLVLDVLRSPPFEPMSQISLANLTVKTIFLVALASGSRRSELHAITLFGSMLSRDKRSFVLRIDPDFLAKTDRKRARKERTMIIPALPDDDPIERALCPVRALNFYLERTKPIRSSTGAMKLFVAYKPGYRGDICALTIARWIKKAVKWSYEAAHKSGTLLHLHQIRAHEVRAFSASLAHLGDISSEKILRAANWKSHNTFTTFYLRDLSSEIEGLKALGPLVAAREVVRV